MAGIGFRIQKMLSKDTYFDTFRAYFYSALILAGPWIMSILTIASLSFLNPTSVDPFELIYFRTTITYIFAFSLIGTGLLYLSMSRYLSDKLYLKEEFLVTPMFNSSALAVLVVQAITGFLIFAPGSTDPIELGIIVCTFLTISLLWIVLIFLTVLRDYNWISVSFVLGAVLSVSAGLMLGDRFGLKGYFAGYFLGQFITLILLASRVFIEFPTRLFFDMGLFRFVLSNKEIVWAGFFYNVAIWADKIVFWYFGDSINLGGVLRTSPVYEGAIFIACLTMIPSLSIFMVEMETDFYKHYKNFYDQILGRMSYARIREAKDAMKSSLRRSVSIIVTVQGMISLLFITYATEIGAMIKMSSIQVPVFRITVLGAYVHSLLLINIILLYYFDLKRPALGVIFLFMASNTVITLFSLDGGVPFWGYGYFLSAFVSLAAGFFTLDKKMDQLEYITFALQPVGAHREDEII